MNDCELYQELISRMLDADLTAEEEAALSSHFDTCAECRMMFDAFSGMSGMIADSLEEPPEELFENITAEIRRSEIKKKNRRIHPLLTAAACLAVVLLGVAGLRNTVFAAKGAAAPMAMPEAAVSGDMAAAEAAPAEMPAAPVPAPAAAAGQSNAFFTMAAPAQAFSMEAAAAEEPAEPEECADAGCIAESDAGEYISIAERETMDALRELLSGELAAEEPESRVLYTVYCEEDGSSLQIYETDDGTLFFDSGDNRYKSSCSRENLENFFTASGK